MKLAAKTLEQKEKVKDCETQIREEKKRLKQAQTTSEKSELFEVRRKNAQKKNRTRERLIC